MSSHRLIYQKKIFLKKKYHYYQKIFCYFTNYIGVPIYYCFLPENIYLNKHFISTSKLPILSLTKKQLENKIRWNFKAIIFENLLILPNILVIKYFNVKYKILNQYLLWCCGVIFINHLYIIFGHLSKKILIDQQIEKINDIMEDQLNNVETIICRDLDLIIDQEILSWKLGDYKNNFGDNTYLVTNMYFINLYFVFNNYQIAYLFYQKVKLLSKEKIIELSKDPYQLKNFKNDFYQENFSIGYYSCLVNTKN